MPGHGSLCPCLFQEYPRGAFFNTLLLSYLSWNPLEATVTPESHGSGRSHARKEDGFI